MPGSRRRRAPYDNGRPQHGSTETRSRFLAPDDTPLLRAFSFARRRRCAEESGYQPLRDLDGSTAAAVSSRRSAGDRHRPLARFSRATGLDGDRSRQERRHRDPARNCSRSRRATCLLTVAHRDELIAQLVEKFHAANPAAVIGIEKADQRASAACSIVVATVQTLSGPRLREFLERFGPPRLRLHHRRGAPRRSADLSRDRRGRRRGHARRARLRLHRHAESRRRRPSHRRFSQDRLQHGRAARDRRGLPRSGAQLRRRDDDQPRRRRIAARRLRDRPVGGGRQHGRPQPPHRRRVPAAHPRA